MQCSYTMESTYCGTDQGPYKVCSPDSCIIILVITSIDALPHQDRQITTDDLEEMGYYFCRSLGLLKSFALVETVSEQDAAVEQEKDERHSLQSSERYFAGTQQPSTLSWGVLQ